MFDSTFISSQSAGINEDMRLLKQFSHPSIDYRSSSLTQISQLGQLLKARNAKFKYNEQAKNITHEWMKRKGTDISPLIQRIKTLKLNSQKDDMKKKAEEDCYFYISDLGYANQKQYIKKNFQYGLFCSMQTAMSQNKKQRGNFAERILQEKKDKYYNSNRENRTIEVPMINVHPRNKNKKQVYVKATKNYIDDHHKNSLQHTTKWVQIYRMAVREYFWEILKAQGLAVQLGHPMLKSEFNNFVLMSIASLKLLEAEYNNNLPNSYENILFYLNTKYLCKMNGQYLKEGVLGATWGVAFLLYQAGRKQQFYEYIRDDELRTAFKNADQAIDSSHPQKISQGQQNSDAFHDQLLYALQGIPKYTSEALCDIDSHDAAWIFLRNVAIFGDSDKFQILKGELFRSYKKSFLNQTKVKNLLYLLSYGEIAEIGTNDIMDQDDYLHYLIAIYYSTPFLQRLGPHKPNFETKLTQQILNYIHELLLQGDYSYIYYMILVPDELLPNQISSIIVSSQLLQKIDWKFLKKKLSKQLFDDLVQKTLDKHVIFHQDYLSAAKKQCQLLDKNRKAIEFILEMNIKSMLEFSFSKKQIQSGDSIVQQIMKKQPNLEKQFSSVFKLFEENRNLCELISQRDQNKLQSYLRNCQHILISEQIRSETRLALNKLISMDGFQCYIKYIKNTVQASEIALIKKGRIKDLQQIQNITLKCLNSLLRLDQYNKFIHQPSTTQLRTMLQNSLYNVQ